MAGKQEGGVKKVNPIQRFFNWADGLKFGGLRQFKSGKQWGVGIFAAILTGAGVDPSSPWFSIMVGVCQFAAIIGSAMEDYAQKKKEG